MLYSKNILKRHLLFKQKFLFMIFDKNHLFILLVVPVLKLHYVKTQQAKK
jgi:hypothetical protein